MKDYRRISMQLVDVLKPVAAFIRGEQGKLSAANVEVKSLNSLVSYVDKKAESDLVAALEGIFPGAGFIAEEGTGKANKEGNNWIIDPLDGTTNYLHHMPEYSISVALQHEGELVVGAIYLPHYDHCYYTWKGGGAWCDGRAISVRRNARLEDSLLATGFPYYDFKHKASYLQLLGECFERTRGVRRLGSAAIDLAYVASGIFDAYFEYGLSPWDVAAGILLVREAGGEVEAFNSGVDPLFGGEIIASSSSLNKEVAQLVRRHLIPAE